MSITEGIGNIRVQSANRKKSKHNYSHHVNTSMNFTDIAPVMCAMSHAGDEHHIRAEQLVWVAPLINPVFGTLKYHQWHYFVKSSDLSRNFTAMMSQTRVARESVVTPEYMAYVRKGLLSCIPLFESFCTVWRADNAGGDQWTRYKLFGAQLSSPTVTQDLITAGVIRWNASRKFDGLAGYEIDMRKILSSSLWTYPNGNAYSSSLSLWVPLSNPVEKSFLDSKTSAGNSDYLIGGVNCTPVQLQKADAVIEQELTIGGATHRYAFAFRLSDFGRRLKKCLEASGIRIDFSSTEYKDFMSLIAIYKAYFDSFGILQYQNWEDTNAARLLYMMDHINDYQVNYFLNNNSNEAGNRKVIQDALFGFIYDLGMLFSTDSANFISAITRQDAVSPQVSSDFINVIPDVGGNTSLAISNGTDQRGTDGLPNANPTDSTASNHAFINRIFHGQVDAELLKKLYLWTNRNTVAGQRIYELLRLQGLGKWADDQKVNFVGHTELEINFDPVTSLADTYQNVADGRLLGERGAKGQGYDEGKNIDYTCDEIGYYVILSAVIPESGYLQQDDGRSSCVRKFDLFNPEFDAVGYEAVRKSQVCGELVWVNMNDKLRKPLDAVFGYAPHYSTLKVMHNKAMGDFSLRSERDKTLSFCLDKYIDLNSHDFVVSYNDGGGNVDNSYTQVDSFLTFGADELPVAGTVWRYNARYPWLGHLYRIFALVGDAWEQYIGFVDYEKDINGQQKYELYSRTSDNFIVQMDINYICYSMKLQIGDSYETTSDGNEGATDTNVSHA